MDGSVVVIFGDWYDRMFEIWTACAVLSGSFAIDPFVITFLRDQVNLFKCALDHVVGVEAASQRIEAYAEWVSQNDGKLTRSVVG